MKIIKSFYIAAVSLCSTTLLHAQELKTEIAKPIECKLTPTASSDKQDDKKVNTAIPAGEEGKKIMAGNTTQPKPGLLTIVTADPPAPAIPTQNAGIKKSQQQQ